MQKGGNLSVECIDTSELDSSFHSTTNDRGTHLAAVALVECNDIRCAKLFDVDLRAIHTAISGDIFMKYGGEKEH